MILHKCDCCKKVVEDFIEVQRNFHLCGKCLKKIAEAELIYRSRKNPTETEKED